jgi:hypothetical protein
MWQNLEEVPIFNFRQKQVAIFQKAGERIKVLAQFFMPHAGNR